jgi:RHS repeat-associated protein
VAGNSIGRLTSAGAGGRRIAFQYDARGRAVAKTHALEGKRYTFTTTYGDQSGGDRPSGSLIVAETFSDGEEVRYTYDSAGAQQAITSAGAPIITRIGRNARGQAIDTHFGDGTVTTQAFRESADLRLATIRTTSGSSDLQSHGYAFDAAGNVIAVQDYRDGTLSASYSYDSLDRLTAMSSPAGAYSYGYDTAGNLTNKEGQAQQYGQGAGPHALTSSGSARFAYDRNGNALQADGVDIAWNAENMPVKQARGATVVTKSFVGEELWKRVEPGKITYFLPSERIENGKLRKLFGKFAERDSDDSNRLKFYHWDHVGSSTLVTDAGAVLYSAAYFPFAETPDGSERLDSASFPFQPKYRFGFREREDAAKGGFYDFGARLYNPRAGRFLSPDTSTADGYNRYQYGHNNPLRFNDPTGHQENDAVRVPAKPLAPPPLVVTTVSQDPPWWLRYQQKLEEIATLLLPSARRPLELGKADRVIVLAAKDSRFYRLMSRWLPPPGTFVVVGHANPRNMASFPGKGFSPEDPYNGFHRLFGEDMVALIRSAPGYSSGMPVLLLGCDTGAGPMSIRIADELGVRVTGSIAYLDGDSGRVYRDLDGRVNWLAPEQSWSTVVPGPRMRVEPAPPLVK